MASTRDPAVRAQSWPQVQDFVQRHGGVEYAYEQARAHGEQAKSALLGLDGGSRQDLLTVAVEYVINRLK